MLWTAGDSDRRTTATQPCSPWPTLPSRSRSRWAHSVPDRRPASGDCGPVPDTPHDSHCLRIDLPQPTAPPSTASRRERCELRPLVPDRRQPVRTGRGGANTPRKQSPGTSGSQAIARSPPTGFCTCGGGLGPAPSPPLPLHLFLIARCDAHPVRRTSLPASVRNTGAGPVSRHWLALQCQHSRAVRQEAVVPAVAAGVASLVEELQVAGVDGLGLVGVGANQVAVADVLCPGRRRCWHCRRRGWSRCWPAVTVSRCR